MVFPVSLFDGAFSAVSVVPFFMAPEPNCESAREKRGKLGRLEVLPRFLDILMCLFMAPVTTAAVYERSAASWAGSRSWKVPAKTNSVTRSSSDVLTCEVNRGVNQGLNRSVDGGPGEG